MMCERPQVCTTKSHKWRRLKGRTEPRASSTYYASIPMISDRLTRRFDSARLKELRKQLDSGLCSQDEIDSIAHDLLEESADVSEDFLQAGIVVDSHSSRATTSGIQSFRNSSSVPHPLCDLRCLSELLRISP